MAKSSPIKLPESPAILVRGVNWLGDAVMTTPALLRLRERYPNARITLLTHAKLADLWWQHPAVDSVIIFQKSDSLWKIGRQLRETKFDVGLALPNSPRTALELWLGRIPIRVGVARPLRNLFLTCPVPPRPGAMEMHKRSEAEIKALTTQSPAPFRAAIPPEAHHIHQYLHLVAALGANPAPVAPLITVLDSEVASIKKRFNGDISPSLPILGINAGAEYGPAKRWPEERFIQSAVAVLRQTHCQCWVLGGPGEKEFANGIASEIQKQLGSQEVRVHCLAGRMTLRELCAALKACDVLLTNDTGPTHVAAAVGTPVVVPFGSTSSELTAPGLPGDTRHAILQSHAPCSPCFLRQCPIDFRCMKEITVEQVVKAVHSILLAIPSNGVKIQRT